MSEYVSYSTGAIAGNAGGLVQQALKKRGISFHDKEAWKTAEKRVEELEKALREELDAKSKPAVDRALSNRATEEVARLDAMLSAFCRISEFKGFAEQAFGKEFRSLQSEAEAFKNAVDCHRYSSELVRSAIRTQKHLEKLATRVQRELCNIEKQVMIETVSGGLHDLGYTVEINGNAIRATLGQTCIWAEVNQYGELSVDLSGFSGLTCVNEIKRVEDELKRRGIILQRRSSQTHTSLKGGSLAKKLRPLFPEFRRIARKPQSPLRIRQPKREKE